VSALALVHPPGGGSRQVISSPFGGAHPDWQPLATLTADPTSGPAGSTVQLTGNGFWAGETIKLSFSDSGTSTTFATFTADPSGNFSVSETIPASAAAASAKFKAHGASSGKSASAKFAVS
jgi:hypothetical protein